MDLAEIKRIIEEQGTQWAAWQAENEKKFADLAKRTRPGSEPAETKSGGIPREIGEALRKAFAGDDTELKSMATIPDSTGGYLIVPQIDASVRLIREQVSPFSALGRTVTLTEGNELLMPSAHGTMPTGWVAESESRPETDTPDLKEHRIPLHELYAMPGATQRLLDDSHWDVGAMLTDMIAHGLASAEDTALHTGDGVGKPRGLLTYTTAATADATRTWGVVEHIPTGASGAFHTTKADPLFDVVASLQAKYRPNARWLMSRSTVATLHKLKEATSDQYLWQPGLQMGQPDTLLGYPIVVDDSMPAIAANSLSMAFGDFSQAYVRIERPGFKLLRDPYTTKGRVLFYAYSRRGAGLVNSECVKFLKFSAS